LPSAVAWSVAFTAGVSRPALPPTPIEKKRCCHAAGNCIANFARPSGAPSPCVATVPRTSQCAGLFSAAATGDACVMVTPATCSALSASVVQSVAAKA
jgi:hypothetical protein